MKPRSVLADSAPSRELGLKFWLSCLAALALLLVLAIRAFYPKGQTSPSAKPALEESIRPHAMAQDAMPDAPMPVNLYRLALNAASLAPLMDDDEPPQWADAAIDFDCGPRLRGPFAAEISLARSATAATKP